MSSVEKPGASRQKGVFLNTVPTSTVNPRQIPRIFWSYFVRPETDKWKNLDIPVQPLDGSLFSLPPSEDIKIYWLGHSSLLMEMEGRRFLFDPVLSQRISMVQWAGPSRFHKAPLSIPDIMQVDAVILSHDHYDHMDYHTLTGIKDRVKRFIVPVGVGSILEKWGINREKITELDWWQETKLGHMTLAATPARHFSGRGLLNRNTTLWCSWCLAGQNKNVYYCGDSGIMPDFEDIGKHYGPFDLTFMPIGAYSHFWHDIHTDPEEAVEAHLQVKGGKIFPIHWATFDLALHSWLDPIERFMQAAEKYNLETITPRIGEPVGIHHHQTGAWWRK